MNQKDKDNTEQEVCQFLFSNKINSFQKMSTSGGGERNLCIFVKDFQLDLNTDRVSDISCYISVNSPATQSSRYIDMILLGNPSTNRIKIPVPEPYENLQFIFKRLKNSEQIGSISFSSGDYFQVESLSNATQWC